MVSSTETPASPYDVWTEPAPVPVSVLYVPLALPLRVETAPDAWPVAAS